MAEAKWKVREFEKAETGTGFAYNSTYVMPTDNPYHRKVVSEKRLQTYFLKFARCVTALCDSVILRWLGTKRYATICPSIFVVYYNELNCIYCIYEIIFLPL